MLPMYKICHLVGVILFAECMSVSMKVSLFFLFIQNVLCIIYMSLVDHNTVMASVPLHFMHVSYLVIFQFMLNKILNIRKFEIQGAKPLPPTPTSRIHLFLW